MRTSYVFFVLHLDVFDPPQHVLGSSASNPKFQRTKMFEIVIPNLRVNLFGLTIIQTLTFVVELYITLDCFSPKLPILYHSYEFPSLLPPSNKH